MTAFTGSTAFQALMLELKSAIVLALQGEGITFERVAVMPGAIAWDGCDQCGLLAISVQRQYFASMEDFPTELSTSLISNIPLLTGDIAVQAIRCAPVPDASGNYPSVSALESSSAQVARDAFVVLCATQSTLTTMRAAMRIEDFLIRQQVIVGPEGACVGSELSVAVGLMS